MEQGQAREGGVVLTALRFCSSKNNFQQKKVPARCRINIIHQIATSVTMAPDKKDKKRKGMYIFLFLFYGCPSY